MKPLKFKNRHKRKLSETIGLNSYARIMNNLRCGIARAFPDKRKQQKYLLALYEGLETEQVGE